MHMKIANITLNTTDMTVNIKTATDVHDVLPDLTEDTLIFSLKVDGYVVLDTSTAENGWFEMALVPEEEG